MAIKNLAFDQIHSKAEVMALLKELPVQHLTTTSKTVTVVCQGADVLESVGNELLYANIQHRWFRGNNSIFYCIITLGEPYSKEDMARLESGLKPLAESI